ncbi:SCO1/SenC-domain-containing protein [Entophlyctis helioformis]|nr:SCO1/SenC-domain-containing protein [Entophlyctis helioformis]
MFKALANRAARAATTATHAAPLAVSLPSRSWSTLLPSLRSTLSPAPTSAMAKPLWPHTAASVSACALASARMAAESRRCLSTQKAPKSGTTSEDMRALTIKSMAALLVSGLALLAYFQSERSKVEELREKSKNEAVGKPKLGGSFTLVDHDGRPVTDLDFRGKFMLLYFGYTFCPDVCPEELEKMAVIVDGLNHNAGYSEDTIVPIFISCDPKRDSVESIREYLKDFHPKFVGMTGTYNQIRRIAKAYRLYFSAPPRAVDDDDTDYLVDHSIFFYLVDPDGQYVAHFGKNETAEQVTAKIVDQIKQREAAGKSRFGLAPRPATA